MDPTTIIMIVSFVGVLALVFGIGHIIVGNSATNLENRLAAFTGKAGQSRTDIADSIVRDGLSTATGAVGKIVARFEKLPLFFAQAECPMKFDHFLLMCGGLSALGAMAIVILRVPAAMIPVGAITGFVLPWGWLWWRRRRRFSKFEKQLPDALDLMSRALRSGHSLASSLNVVATEMQTPISAEFKTVYEEQNLGIPMEGALRNMLGRIPNMDLQFFVTAVAIQRQAGGDLSEILNKISGLVRERFKILGQVKALTGEGRISGIVLMALPIGLFFVIYYLNPEYVMVLFEHELGKQMMLGAVVLQIFGALVIKKIVDIKV
jgi:tight adherence protein B